MASRRTTSTRISTTRKTVKLSALKAKAGPTPAVTMMMPATAGPMKRARLKMKELRPIAAPIPSCGTRVGTSACLAAV